MRAFYQSDAGGWSSDIPEREEDEAPDVEGREARRRVEDEDRRDP